MEKLFFNRDQYERRKTDLNERNMASYIRRVKQTEPIHCADYLKSMKSESVKDHYHSVILQLGHTMWINNEGERKKELDQRLSVHQKRISAELRVENERDLNRSRDILQREINTSREQLDNHWNMKLQAALSKVEDEMANRTEIALKEQKVKLNAEFDKRIHSINKEWIKRLSEEVDNVTNLEVKRNEEGILNLQRKFEYQNQKLLKDLAKKHDTIISEQNKGWTLEIEKLEDINKQKSFQIDGLKTEIEMKDSTKEIGSLYETIKQRDLSIDLLKKQISESTDKERSLRQSLLLLQTDFDHFIQTTIKIPRSGSTFLLPTPREISDLICDPIRAQKEYPDPVVKLNPKNIKNLNPVSKKSIHFSEDFLN